MMRRRVFLSADFIEASRDFVCVRMNPWLDELNAKRCTHMLGFHQNTAIALVAPDARGVSRDSFPGRADCYWQMYTEPEESKEMTTVKGASQILPAMAALSKAVAQKSGADATRPGLPGLPVQPDLVQTLNLGACDGRMVVVLAGSEALEPAVAALAFDERFAGTAHYVRMSADAWSAAIAEEKVRGETGDGSAGLFVVKPEPFGRFGEVLARAGDDSTPAELAACLAEGLQRFRREFHKLDRSKHFLVGRRDSIFWEEYKPQVADSSGM